MSERTFRTAVVVTSAGPAYADPWHDLTGTAALVAAELTAAGLDVQVRDDVLAAVEEHAGRALLVVCCSGAPEPDARDLAEADALGAALDQHAAAGAPVLALHAASMAFATVPAWRRLLGARWVHGTSGHPDLGPCTVRVADGDHPVTAGLGDVDVVDERYSDLELAPDRDALVVHEHDGRTHPVVLAGTVGTTAGSSDGGSRVVYDALGHDGRSYESAARRELLRREARWAAGLTPVA